MLRVNLLAHLSTGVEVFSMKLIIFSFTFTDLDLRANVILFTKDLTPLPSPELLSDSPWVQKCRHLLQKTTLVTTRQPFKVAMSLDTLRPPTSAELRLLWEPEVLTIQWMYEESRPSTFMSARCCWRAENTAPLVFLACDTLWRKVIPPYKMQPLTHEASFSNANIFLIFLWKKKKAFNQQRTSNRPCSPYDTQASHTCKKCASTMFIYMSSSSLPLPMKHKCSPLAMEPDSKDCFWASSRDFTERANSEGFWSICARGKEHSACHLEAADTSNSSFCADSGFFCPTRSESKWKAVDRCPELYCSAGRQSTTKNRTPS